MLCGREKSYGLKDIKNGNPINKICAFGYFFEYVTFFLQIHKCFFKKNNLYTMHNGKDIFFILTK